MDDQRRKVKETIMAANRGPFGGWWEDLLAVDPTLCLRVHRTMLAAETSGPLPRHFRHLIVGTVDSVVTHLYPRGIGVHMRIALEHGATRRQVVEALEISASVCTGRSFAAALPLINVVFPDAAAEKDASWLATLARRFPDIGTAFDDLSNAPNDDEGLDAKHRELLFLAAYACPAILDRPAIELHMRQAAARGATVDEVMQTVAMANLIGLHPVVEGVLQLRAVFDAMPDS